MRELRPVIQATLHDLDRWLTPATDWVTVGRDVEATAPRFDSSRQI
jgi:hypothetical protein